MPRVTIGATAIKGPYPGTVSATDLDYVYTAADTANQNQFLYTGKEILLAQNVDASPHTITLTSIGDSKLRTGDITTYSLGAGLFMAFNFANGSVGWLQTGGLIFYEADNVNIEFAVLRFTS